MIIEGQPKVSVIIPVYNVEKYVGECLDSVIQQTFSDIEIICVDDGSTDGSLKILTDYATRDSRIAIFSKENGGPSSARNTGLKYAKGEYVYFLDSDDKIDLNAIDGLISVAENEKLDVLYFDGTAFYETEQLREQFAQFEKSSSRSKEYSETVSGQKLLADMFQNGDYRASAVKQIIKRAFLEENHIRFYEGIIHEDELFTFTVLLKAQRASHRARKYFLRRVRKDSIMTKPKTYANFKGYFITYKEMLWLAQNTRLEMDSASYIWDKIVRMQRTSFWVYSQLTEKEKKGINWTDDGFTQSLFKMSESQDRIERDRLRNELNKQNNANRESTKVTVYIVKKIRGGIRCYQEHGLKYTVKHTCKKVYRFGKRGVKWLSKRKWGKPIVYALKKTKGGILCLKQHGMLYTVKKLIKHN